EALESVRRILRLVIAIGDFDEHMDLELWGEEGARVFDEVIAGASPDEWKERFAHEFVNWARVLATTTRGIAINSGHDHLDVLKDLERVFERSGEAPESEG